MIPLIVFLLACVAVYLGSIGSAFSALMRLSLRIVAERSDRPGSLGQYLDDPIVLFTPVRVLLGLVTVSATGLMAREIGVGTAYQVFLVILAGAIFVGVFELLLPLLLIGRDPERILELLLPSFSPIARALRPITRWTTRVVAAGHRPNGGPTTEIATDDSGAPNTAYLDPPGPQGISAGEERRLLQSIVDFGDTLVREVMTPRPDIVAIQDEATVADLRALFREQEYSRFPVYKGSLDNIAGFVFVKDLVGLDNRNDTRVLATMLRPVVFVPESKRVPELLKQFQRQQTQIAIVVDEYGGTAGLITIEDMLEELVGEIRDEYDVESEVVVDEGLGRFLFAGTADISLVTDRLGVQIDREGFETVGGYLMTQLGRVPTVGEQLDVDGLHIEVLNVERRRIQRVRMTKLENRPVAESEHAL
jgi:putative hemolysin